MKKENKRMAQQKRAEERERKEKKQKIFRTRLPSKYYDFSVDIWNPIFVTQQPNIRNSLIFQ